MIRIFILLISIILLVGCGTNKSTVSNEKVVNNEGNTEIIVESKIPNINIKVSEFSPIYPDDNTDTIVSFKYILENKTEKALGKYDATVIARAYDKNNVIIFEKKSVSLFDNNISAIDSGMKGKGDITVIYKNAERIKKIIVVLTYTNR